ncbi:hypothetical protein [Rathayibacter tritici]|nr:hypothetical protein [Rathayibacter tritici]
MDLLSDGVVERASVYTVTAWQLATGLRLLRRPRRAVGSTAPAT